MLISIISFLLYFKINKLVDAQIKEFKEELIEIDQGMGGVDEFDSNYYYCHSFETFLKATVHERWGYNIEKEEDKKKLKELMRRCNMLCKDDTILIEYFDDEQSMLLFNELKRLSLIDYGSPDNTYSMLCEYINAYLKIKKEDTELRKVIGLE